jgi:hypothetical protein
MIERSPQNVQSRGRPASVRTLPFFRSGAGDQRPDPRSPPDARSRPEAQPAAL